MTTQKDVLAPCPCGNVPKELCITSDAGQVGKWAYVRGNCCGMWRRGCDDGGLPGDERL